MASKQLTNKWKKHKQQISLHRFKSIQIMPLNLSHVVILFGLTRLEQKKKGIK